MSKMKFKSVGLEFPAYEKLKELAEQDRRSIGKQLSVIIEEEHKKKIGSRVRASGISAALND